MIKKFLVHVKGNSYGILNLELIDNDGKIVVNISSMGYTRQLFEGIVGVCNNKGTWVGSNGDLNRYTGNCIVILLKAKTKEDMQSNVYFYCYLPLQQRGLWLSTTQIINAISSGSFTLANGKVMKTTAGHKYISAIRGNYKEIEVKENEVNRKRIKRDNDRGRVFETLRRDVEKEGSSRGTSEGVGGVCEREIRQGRDSYSCRDRVSRALRGLNITVNENTSPQDFLDITLKAKNDNMYGCCVDAHSLDEYKACKTRISFGTDACIAVNDDGNITNLVKSSHSNIKGIVKQAMTMAVANGGTKGDCYNVAGGLPTLYCQCGFIPVCRVAFMDEFAPDDWDFESLGRPDIVFLAYCGDDADDMYENHKKGYKSFSDYDYDSLPLFTGEDGYNKAWEYRDECIASGRLPSVHTSEFKSIKVSSQDSDSSFDDKVANTLLGVTNSVGSLFKKFKGKE